VSRSAWDLIVVRHKHLATFNSQVAAGAEAPRHG